MKLKKLNFRKKKALPSSPKEEDDEDSTTAILTKKTKLEHEMNRDELLELLKKEREAAASGFLAFVERDLACEGKDDTAIEIESDSSSLTVKTEGALDDIERLRCDINQREDNNMNSNMNPDQLKLKTIHPQVYSHPHPRIHHRRALLHPPPSAQYQMHYTLHIRLHQMLPIYTLMP